MSKSPSAAHQEERMPPTAPAVDPRLRRRGMPGLLGKNVLVTGGTSGIGQATAVRFAEHGANVAINYLTTPDEAAGTEEQVHTCLRKVRQHGVRDVLVQGDVSSEEDVVRMVREAGERLGGLDILINNAGIQISRPSEQLASDGLRPGPCGRPARLVPVRPRGDQAIPRRREARRRDQRLERPRDHPQAELSELQHQQGRDGQHDPDARARIRAPRDPRQRRRPRRHHHPDQPRLGRRPRQDGRWSRATSRWAARARRTRWPGCARSWPPTTPPTSPGRRSSSTAV